MTELSSLTVYVVKKHCRLLLVELEKTKDLYQEKLQETKHPLLHPTWFSFSGLFNIQKYGKPLKYSEAEWLSMILQVTTKQSSHAPGLSHTFGNPKNYTGVYGCIRLIDYGNPKLWPVIRRYGEKIMKITIAECGYPPK